VKMGMRGCFGVDRRRYGGGLALLWYACVTVHIQSYSPSHIDAHVFQDDGISRCFTGFYGHPKTALQYLSWALLLSFHALSDKPWVVLGDFNEILALKEKQGCEDKSFHQMAGFQDVLTNCSLMDFGFWVLNSHGRIGERMMIWFGFNLTEVWRHQSGSFYSRIPAFVI
jgi:hypothetical protein